MTELGMPPNLADQLAAWCRLVEYAPVAMALTLGESHTLHCVSPALAQLFDATPRQLYQRPFAAAVALANSDAVTALLNRVFATGEPEVSAMLEHVHPQRGMVPYTCTAWRVGMADGSRVGLVVQVEDRPAHMETDHTDTALAVHLREVNERLVLTGLREHQARAEAEAALTVRDQFLSIAGHELKSPLTVLIGYTYMLQRRVSNVEVDPVVQQATAQIAHQAKRIDLLIDQLLDVSRLQRGQFSIEQEPLDLRAVVTRVVDGMRFTLKQHTLGLTVADEPVMVFGDDLRLEQVVQNLLDNAVKYSPAGGPVDVRLAPLRADAILEVTDHGIGIPADAQRHVFDSFFRAGNASRFSQGFGIGLYVAKEIVTKHGGRIEVASTEGQGSTFRVVLPLNTEAGL